MLDFAVIVLALIVVVLVIRHRKKSNNKSDKNVSAVITVNEETNHESVFNYQDSNIVIPLKPILTNKPADEETDHDSKSTDSNDYTEN